MECGCCGSMNADYFSAWGVTSVRCPDCGADLLPGVQLRRDDQDPEVPGEEERNGR